MPRLRLSTLTAVPALLGIAFVPAPAPASDAVVGGIVGGVIGGVISGAIQRDQANRARPQQVQRQAPRQVVPNATRVANREMQTALNYFGFDAGGVDGSVGPRTRSAVSRYQAFMGWPVTGQITDFERSFLAGSYQRAMAGGPVTAQLAASHPQGARGLLLHFRDEMAGGAVVAGMPAMPLAVAPQVVIQQPAPQAAAPEPEPAPQAVASMPNFLGAVPEGRSSLASQCNRVNLLTTSAGGFVTLATMTDARFALEEQFCLARTYAIASGEELAARVPGGAPQQIAEQCAGMGAAMKPQLASLALGSPADVLREVAGFVAASGMAPAQLAGTGRICLSSGYRTDDMDTALAAALVLVTAGERSYAELIGHHLAHGFGTASRSDLAVQWYDIGLAALDDGAAAPFLPGQPERVELIRAAVAGVSGRAAAPSAPLTTPAAAVPSFGLVPAQK